MARQSDERFETAGYEESWTETIAGTGVIDEDFATSSVTGAPADWGSQCCKFVQVLSETTITDRTLAADLDVGNVRLETIIEVESLVNAQQFAIAYGRNQASSINRWILYVRQESGALLFRVNLLYDGSSHTFNSGTITLNTRYRHEIRWDSTALVANYLLDGASVSGDQIISAATRKLGMLRLGAVAADAGGGAATYYIDNVVIEDSAWPIGGESSVRVFDETFEGAGTVESWTPGP